VLSIDLDARGFKVVMADGEEFTSRRVVVAAESARLRARPAEFASIPSALASHTSEHNDLRKFKGQRVVVIGAGRALWNPLHCSKRPAFRSR
jgi:FAD-dependent urate hydroxylase